MVVTVASAVAGAFLVLMLSLVGWGAGTGMTVALLTVGALSWRPGTRVLAASVAVAAVATWVFFFPVWRSMYRHDRALANWSAQLCWGPLPPGSLKTECRTSVELTGNGNHCDYEARLLLWSALSRDEVRSFFESRRYQSVGGATLPVGKPGPPSFLSEGGVGVTVRFLDDDVVPTKAEIRLYDPGYPEGYDFRCM